MSRGIGRVERDVLAYLEEHAVTPFGQSRPDMMWPLAAVVQETGHHRESVRRAFKSLARKGLCVLGQDFGGFCYVNLENQEVWVDTRKGPEIRLSVENFSTLTVPERPEVDLAERGRLMAALSDGLNAATS